MAQEPAAPHGRVVLGEGTCYTWESRSFMEQVGGLGLPGERRGTTGKEYSHPPGRWGD